MKCSKCNSENIAITSGTDNRKQPKWYLWFKVGLLIFTAVNILLFSITKNAIPALLSVAGILTILIIAKTQNDYKKDKEGIIRTKAVCKDCGHIEYLD